jgi:riboflavin synthase
MFTGIVTDIGEVIAVSARADNLRQLKIACHYDRAGIVDGASIACNGVCLTVVAAGVDGNHAWFSVDAAAETLAVTTAGAWQRGTRLNLERALKIGDELGGHIVAGHVDGIAELVAREDLTEMARLTFRAPPQLSRFIAAKGSVALDGVSLTVNEAKDDRFEVLIIPHTLDVTTFGALRAGDPVNLEVDLMARYAARLIERP